MRSLSAHCPSVSLTLFAFCFVCVAQQPGDDVVGAELRWSTSIGSSYQLQWSEPGENPTWQDFGEKRSGIGLMVSQFDSAPSGTRQYQVVETVPPRGPVTELAANGGFEEGADSLADGWSSYSSASPMRTDVDAHSGSFSMHARLENLGITPQEGLLKQTIRPRNGIDIGGQPIEFSFWVSQVNSGPSYIQQYQLNWLEVGGHSAAGTGFVNFSGGTGEWRKISAPNIVAPDGATGAQLTFRFVTGAVEGGHGEAYIDDVFFGLSNPADATSEAKTNILKVTTRRVVQKKKISLASADPFPGNPEESSDTSLSSLSLSSQLAAPPSEDDIKWDSVNKTLQAGISNADHDSLLKAATSISDLKNRNRDSREINEIAALVNLYLRYDDKPDQFERSASKWLERYPDSAWSRDVLIDTAYIRIDNADFKGALTLISRVLNRFPSDPEADKLRAIREKVNAFAESLK